MDGEHRCDPQRERRSDPQTGSLLVVIAALIFSASGCGESDTGDTDFPGIEPGSSDRVAVAQGDDPESAEPFQLAPGEPRGEELEDRRALLAIFRGQLAERSTRRYDAELARTIDAELYRDHDAETSGPRQWITRARVVDEHGETLWSDRVNSFYQLLEYLKLVLDQTAEASFTVRQVYGFAESEYPELLEFPVQIPLGFEGGEEYVLEVPDGEGEYYEVARVDIDEMVEQAEPPRYDAEVETLSQNGPPEDRIDVVILADGYTADERSDFRGDARAIVDRFESTKPFDQHSDLLNFHIAWTPSAESGAGYDCIDELEPECNRFRETFYRYVFVVSALSDQFALDLPPASSRVAMPLEVAKMNEVAALASYDEVMLLSNTDRRSGFAGMYAGVLTAFDDREKFPDVAVHEFGHSFGVLGDEYFIESDPCLDNTPRIPLPANITAEPDYQSLKWSHWVPQETPLPTPDQKAASYRVGAYRSAYNCQNLYRPAHNCKMRSSSNTFCAVCTEHLVRRLYNDVDLVRAGYPRVVRREDGGLRFETGARDGGDRTVIRWRLDDERIGDEPTLALGASAVGDEWQKLELEVREYSQLVRKDDPRLEIHEQWWVKR